MLSKVEKLCARSATEKQTTSAHNQRKRDFPRTLTPAILTDGVRIGAILTRSGSGGFGEVEGEQVGNIGVARALRQFGEDVAQPG